MTSFTEYIKITQYQIRRIKLKYIEIKNMTYFLIKQNLIYKIKILIIYKIISFLFPSIFNFFIVFKLHIEINIFNTQ